MTTSYTTKRILKAIEHMATTLESEAVPSLDGIAEASGLSKFHFHRLYRLATGETCKETLTRLRLAKAANALKDPTVSVTDAAFSAGYSSSQAFAKAFRRLVSQTATEVREDEERLVTTIETLVVPKTEAGQPEPALKIELASFDPFDVIALRTDGTYPSLNEHFWTLFEAAGSPENVEAILGRPYGDIGLAAEEPLRFDCALKLRATPDDVADGLEQRGESGGLHLLTRHVGAYEDLPSAIDRLYLAALADADIEISDAPLLFHYLDDPETTAEEDLRTDLYLAVEQPRD